MANGYNHIFKQIVENDDDFVGMVAYTLYKRQKIEWISAFEAEHQRIPSDQEVEDGFIRFSIMPSQRQSYREQAVQVLDLFLGQALSDKVQDYQETLRNDAIIQAVKKPFGQGVAENLVAGVFASLITLGAAGLVWVAAKGPENLLREALGHLLK